jgi:hypothetical protein
VHRAMQAQHWEQLAVLSDEQQSAIDLISEHCAERPTAHVSASTAAVDMQMRTRRAHRAATIAKACRYASLC